MPKTLEERKAWQREYYYRQKLAYPEKAREYNRAWRQAHPEQMQAHRKKWADAHPEELRASRQAWIDRNPERVQKVRKAMHSLLTALRNGVLTRPGACEQCGASCYPDAAHSDYAKPLEVRWLCRSCHRDWDKAEPKSA